MRISKLKKLPLRELWKHEALEFTPWLENNIDFLNEELDINLTIIEREKSVGIFNVDLLAEDEDGNKIIIENQLEKTNHDHLGKVLTYMTNLEAKSAIWICREARPEHKKAINWLDENTTPETTFYLIKVEAYSIDDSPPAPKFSIICGPSDEATAIGKIKRDYAERHYKRLEFWTQLLDKASLKTNLHSTIKPGKYSSIGTGAGKSGLSYIYAIRQHEGIAELYIDKGKDKKSINEEIYNQLHSKKELIEQNFKGSLIWDNIEGKRACLISCRISDYGLDDKDHWNELQDKMIDAMIRLESALREHITNLTI